MTAIRVSRWLLAALLLAGCATSPSPRYYRLAAQAGPVTAVAAPAVAGGLIVGPFRVAEYLDRPQLVALDGPNRVTIDDYERWAEPLDAGFQSVVAATVGRLLGSDRVLEYPAQALLGSAARVSGRITRFDVDPGRRAVLEVQWGVVDAADRVLLPGRASRYEAGAAGDSAAARVAALNATVAAFCDDLAAALRAVP